MMHVITIKFENLTLEFLKNNNNEHIIIEKDGIDFHYIVALKKDSKKLVAFSNGAVNPEIKKPPLFMRSNWLEEMDYNAIFIDDRTVHENDLKIGWGVGTLERHFLKDYSDVVKKIASLLSIKDKDIFYYGSSAGGFMSLALATYHKDSTAIVNNPQTYVYKYFESYYKPLYEIIFPGMEDSEIHKNYSDRLSITNIFRKNKRTPKAFYFQNRLCRSDMKNHLEPFVKTMDKYAIDSESIQFIIYSNKKSGHTPLSKEKTLKLIDMIVHSNDDMTNEAFQPVINHELEETTISEKSVMPLFEYSRHTVKMADSAIEDSIIPFPTFEAVPFSDDIWNIQKGADTVSYQLYIHSWRVVSELLNQFKATQDKKYLLKAKQIIDSWIEHAENLRTDMTWYDHPTANRTQVLIEFMYLMQQHEQDVNLRSYFEQLDVHCQFLMNDEYYRPNNHGLMMDRTLMIAGKVLDNELYLLKGKSRAQQSFWINYSPNGVHLENSPEYHLMVTKMYHSIEDYLIKNHDSLGKEINEVLGMADKYLSKIAKPDGKIPAIGDSSEIQSPSKKIVWENFHDTSSGMTVIKDEANEFYLAFICGFSTATHKHPDDLSVLINYKNEDFFVDSGKFNYSRSPGRSYVSSLGAHSSYQLGQNYTRSHENRITQKIKTDFYADTSQYTVVSGSHNGYRESSLRRTVYYIKKFNIVFIEDKGHSNKNQKWVNRFNLSEKVEIEALSNSAIKLKKKNTFIELENLSGHPLEINTKTKVKGISQPFIAKKVNQKLATKQLLFTEEEVSQNKFLTLIRLGEVLELKIKQTEDEYIFIKEGQEIKLPKIK